MSESEVYRLYLERFERAMGRADVGAYGKHHGAMIKKLSAAEFDERWSDFVDLRANYENILAHGYTVDNVLLKVLRERAAELIVELPDLA